jgi:hypothetical protein
MADRPGRRVGLAIDWPAISRAAISRAVIGGVTVAVGRVRNVAAVAVRRLSGVAAVVIAAVAGMIVAVVTAAMAFDEDSGD